MPEDQVELPSSDTLTRPLGHSNGSLPVMLQPENSLSWKQCPPNGPQLPMELWSEIFELAMPDREALDQLQGQTESEVPMSLTRTCRSWRQIAMATPRIWTDIDVFIPNAGSVSPSLEVLKSHLRKSGNCPLNIALWGSNTELKDDDWTMNESILQTLVLEIRRWKTASLYMVHINNDLLSNFLRLPTSLGIETGAPLLESLVVCTRYYPIGSQYNDFPLCIPTILWKNAPVLRKFVLDHEFSLNLADRWPGGHSECWPSTSHIPYHQLTVLQLDGSEVKISELITIFQSSPNLIACRILHLAIYTSLSSDTDPEADLDRSTDTDSPSEDYCRKLKTKRIRETHGDVLLPNLKHLRLDISDFTGRSDYAYPLSKLLDRLTTPALVSLSMFYDELWGRAHLPSFIKRSGCTLQELYIIFYELLSEDLIVCMRINPSLKVLHFTPRSYSQAHIYDVDNIFLELLRWDSERHQFTTCPVLEDFCMGSLCMPNKEPGKQCQVEEMKRARTAACGESFHFGTIENCQHFSDAQKYFIVPLRQEESTDDSASVDQEVYPHVT